MSLLKEHKEKVLKEFGASNNDTGSIGIQVALLTERINQLTGHLKEFNKDFSSKRGMLKLIGRRRKIMKYLKKSDQKLYNDVTKRLGL